MNESSEKKKERKLKKKKKKKYVSFSVWLWKMLYEKRNKSADWSVS